MKFQPFDTYGMDDDEVSLLKETCGALSKNYKTEFVNVNQRKDLGSNFTDIQETIAGVAVIESEFKRCILVFTKAGFQTSTKYWSDPKLSNCSYQMVAFTQLRRNFGTVFIRKKSKLDGFLDMFTSVAVTFKNHKAFNRKFYVLAEDKEKAAVTINDEVIGLLMKISKEGFSINITNKKLIVECPYSLSRQKAVKLAEFACSMSLI